MSADAWWDNLVAHVRAQAEALRQAGWTYESAAWERAGQPGVGAGWPLLAERLLDEGYSWASITQQLGLNDDQDDDGVSRELVKRLENQAATIMRQATTITRLQEQVSRNEADLHEQQELNAELAAQVSQRSAPPRRAEETSP